MRNLLRNALTGLSMTLLLAAGCGIQEEFNADDSDIASAPHALSTSTEASLKNKSFTITSTKSANLWDALYKTGAKVRSIPGSGFLELGLLDCSAPGTFGIHSCDMLQNGVAISTTGPTAKAVVDALVAAGVKGLPTTTGMLYSIKPLRCSRTLLAHITDPTCTFTAQYQ